MKYRVARNFCGSLFLQIGDFFGTNLREIILVIRTDWFFLLGINFCDFQKAPSTQMTHGNLFIYSRHLFSFLDYVLILSGQNLCWSIIGLKGVTIGFALPSTNRGKKR